MKTILSLLVVFASFSIYANPNLVTDTDESTKTVLIGVWSISSLLLILTFVPLYLVKRKRLFGILADIGFISLIFLLIKGLGKLSKLDNAASGDSTKRIEMAGMNPQFWIFLILAVVLTLGMIVFIWFQVRDYRKRN